MKVSAPGLIALSLCLAQSAFAGDTILLSTQQNSCANMQGSKNSQRSRQAQTSIAKSSAPANKTAKSATQSEHPVDLVICLDTSNSMDGLIDSAKEKLWDIVNELATASPKPHLRVGLYAYGSPGFGSQSGYVHKVLDLTDDLDKVFTELNSLRTSGGDEYCAAVISAAMKQQAWSKGKRNLKIIVTAGNEAATQDPRLNVFEVAKEAVAQGIIINTIFCGSPLDSMAGDWRKVASSADGQFAAIDQNHGTVTVSTPFDKKLAELNGSINSTYLAYGSQAESGLRLQGAADSLSMKMGAANLASRAQAKISGQYRNSSWDLVDASLEKGFSLSKIEKAKLPSQMQKMNINEQSAYLSSKVKERADIQKQIAELTEQRARYIQEEIKRSGKSVDKAFDTAMLKALRAQAQKNGFTFAAK